MTIHYLCSQLLNTISKRNRNKGVVRTTLAAILIDMKNYLIIIFIILPIFTNSQDYFFEFEGYNSEHNFDWRGLETGDKYEVKESFVKYIKKTICLSGKGRT